MSDFVISSALERAEKIIEERKVWKLNPEDSASFVQTLMSDKEPHDRLKIAAERYKKSSLER